MSLLLVFGQDPRTDLPLSDLRARAERFFSTKVGLREPETQAAKGVVSATLVVREELRGKEAFSSVVTLRMRPSQSEDRAHLRASREASENGLAALGERCATVFELDEGEGEGDSRGSLLLAAILASAVLGPIVQLSSREVFGVKTAREKLDRL